MKKCLRLIISSFIILLAFCGFVKSTPKSLLAADSIDSYYAGINANSSSLLSDLQRLNQSKKKKNVGYSNFGSYYKRTDGDPNNPNNLIVFYSGTSHSFSGSFSSGINREHVWPNSRGGNYVEGDIHMPRPTLNSENGSRGNSFYVEGKKSSSGGWDPAMESFGLEKYRGIAARIIFYCVVADSRLSLVDKDNDDTGNHTMGKLSDLLKWNLAYDIDETETRRNDAAEDIQGNRNPFIDHPEYACQIWGKTNATTQSICANGGGQDDSKSDKEAVEADALELQQTYNETFKNPITELGFLKAKGTKGSNISWVSSNTEAFKIESSNGVTIHQSDKNVTLKLTATLSKGDESKTIDFNVTIKHNIAEPQLKPILKENQEVADTSEKTYEATLESKIESSKLELNGLNWTFTNQKSDQYMGSGGSKGTQLGSSGNPGGGTFVTSDLANKSIKSIGFEGCTASSGNTTAKIYIGNQEIFSQKLTTTSTYYEATNPNNYTGDIKIEYVVTSKASYIKSIKIVYSDSGLVDANETTYASISLQNPSIRFGITLSKQAILKTLSLDAVDMKEVELGVYAVTDTILKEYGYESLAILNVSPYSSRLFSQPLFTYQETSESTSTSLLLYNVDIQQKYYAVCYLKFQNQYYFAKEICVSYFEIAQANYDKLNQLKEDLISKDQYNNEYEKQLQLLKTILE